MVTVREFLNTLTGPDRVKIIKDGKMVFLGFKAAIAEIPEEYLNAEMLLFDRNRRSDTRNGKNAG